ncbi:MAG: hypothetical protein D6697_04910 [Armatimonadetes bacterium]|jgi:hypothetical protein|nr:MAG: hypothetical protein D6697_04910 [Armatimonadota bacterium]
MVKRRILSAGVLWLVLILSAFTQGVPCSECFPLEQLEPRLRPQAEQTLLKMLDRESLYTVIGGLKPMSSGFVTITYGAEPLDKETYQQLIDLRTILRAFRCGDELYADMMVFRRTDDGKKTAHAVVINTRALRETIRRYATFFAKLGVTENSHPMEVVMAVEHATPSDRHRGYGYLFGYPKYAVDFFVEAAEHQQRTGEFVERDFFHIPTFERETNQFVWAVPKGHTPNTEDLERRARAEAILKAYRARREQYIGEGKPGVVQLLRDWLRDHEGRCSLQHTAPPKEQGIFPQ